MPTTAASTPRWSNRTTCRARAWTGRTIFLIDVVVLIVEIDELVVEFVRILVVLVVIIFIVLVEIEELKEGPRYAEVTRIDQETKDYTGRLGDFDVKF